MDTHEIALIGCCLLLFLCLCYYVVVRFDLVLQEIYETKRNVYKLRDRLEPEGHKLIMQRETEMKVDEMGYRVPSKNYTWTTS